MIKSDHHPRTFGSTFDALLDGVAHGLADLFPLPEPVIATDDPHEEIASEPQEKLDE